MSDPYTEQVAPRYQPEAEPLKPKPKRRIIPGGCLHTLDPAGWITRRERHHHRPLQLRRGASRMSSHRVLPDGYCETCHAIPCRGSASPVGGTRQWDRIEAKLNKILRHLGLDDEA